MARSVYKIDKETGELVEIYNDEKAREKAPYIFTDEIDPVESMATAEGKVFTSLSKLKAHYKAHGYEMTGGDHLTGKVPEKPKVDINQIRADVMEAKRKLEWGMAPLTDMEKEQCHREMRESKKYRN